MNAEKQFLAEVLRVIESREIKITKVLLHKFIYFLTYQGMNTRFRFEPYIYGPYSFGLSETIESMDFWDNIKENHSEIEVLDLAQYPKTELYNIIGEKFDLFHEKVGELTFSNLECIGTTLYCVDVLKKYGDSVTFNNVRNEFKEWKKNRYSDAEIQVAYEKVISLIDS